LLRGILDGREFRCPVARAGTLLDSHFRDRRYFAHRTFRTSRILQFGLAFLSQTAAQRSILRWAAKHRLWLDRHSYAPLAALALVTWLIAGWSGLVISFCFSTVAVWHVTFSVNSLSHLVGRGEGWHKNHHAYQASAHR
jgi:stearoyl-CoA desaturase (Delta-9 desaturase)